MKTLFLLSILICLSGWHSFADTSNKENPLTEETFIQLYVENSLLTEKFLNSQDSLSFYQEQLFKKYQATPEIFLDFLQQFDQEPEKYTSIWQKIALELEKRKAEKKK